MSSLWRAETRAILRLGGPLMLAFAGNQALGLVDTLVAGHLDAVTLAGVGLGNPLHFLCVMVGYGILMGLDPIAAQAVGAGDEAGARRGLNDALVVAALITLPIMALAWLYTPPLLEWVAAPEASHGATMQYLTGRIWGTLPMLVIIAQRSYLQARDTTGPIVASVIVANCLNLPLSALMGAGDQAFAWIGLDWQPGLKGSGAAGIGAASSFVSLVQAGYLVWVIRRLPRPAGDLRPSAAGIGRIFGVGLPIGLAFFGEAGVFTLVSVLMATFGTVAVGGHQIALQLASFTFTICLGISAATTVRVGQAIGRGDGLAARLSGLTGGALAIGVMMCTATLFTLFPERLVERFTTDPAVIAVGVPLLQVAGAFQIFDGVQVVMGGALRGLADTTFAMAAALIGYWGVALPLGWHLATTRGWGPEGLWWGLTGGLGLVGAVVSLRFMIMATRVRALARS